MPMFSRVLGQLEEHIKQGKRDRLRHRAMVVVAQDRVDHMVVTTGWRPPGGVTRQRETRHG